jgi:hypothetical protein
MWGGRRVAHTSSRCQGGVVRGRGQQLQFWRNSRKCLFTIVTKGTCIAATRLYYSHNVFTAMTVVTMTLSTIDGALWLAGLICLSYANRAQQRMVKMINRQRPPHQQWPVWGWEPKPDDWRVWGGVPYVQEQYRLMYRDRELPRRCNLAFFLCLSLWMVDLVAFPIFH